MIDQCHTPRSQAKKSPAAIRGTNRESAVSPFIRSFNTHNHSSGVASAQRQKALATGPVSARRTRMGAKAIAQPPARRQRNAAVESEARAGSAETPVMEPNIIEQ